MAKIEAITSGESRYRHRLSALALGVALITAFETTLADGVYRWVDEQGEVHYGDRLPSAEESTRLKIKSAPVPAPGDDERRARTRRLLDAFESERERNKQKAAQAKAEKVRREQNCQSARRQVTLVERANGMFVRGPDGKRSYLNDKERDLALERARGLVDRWCN